MKNALPEQTKRAVDLAAEKGASTQLTVIPVKDVDFTLNKREFKDAIYLRYDWQISDARLLVPVEIFLMHITPWFADVEASLFKDILGCVI